MLFFYTPKIFTVKKNTEVTFCKQNWVNFAFYRLYAKFQILFRGLSGFYALGIFQSGIKTHCLCAFI